MDIERSPYPRAFQFDDVPLDSEDLVVVNLCRLMVKRLSKNKPPQEEPDVDFHSLGRQKCVFSPASG